MIDERSIRDPHQRFRLTEGAPSPTASDRALIRAILAWGGRDFSAYSSRFSESWQGRLRAAWPSDSMPRPDEAWANLRSDHEASARPDPARVHPSWFVRALQSESAAVRLAVAAHAPRPIREALRRGLGIDRSELISDREPDPEALGWVLALWAERLVGDVPRLDNDPMVVVALTKLRPRDLARLVRVCGLAKHAFALNGNGLAGLDESSFRFTTLDRVRLGFFKRHIGVADPKIVPLARLDLESIKPDRRRGLARVGLLSFGRLLGAVEPHRARWALQHIPYPVARLMRKKTRSGVSSKSLVVWESWVLEAAWSRLIAEGRLPRDRPWRTEIAAGARP